MALVHELENTGNWLFKRRGWLPILILIPAVLIILINKELDMTFGLAEEMIFLGVSMTGQIVRALTVGFTPKNTSGRNVKGQVADELNRSGIYSIVRHPLYVGNFLMWLGPVLFIRSVCFTVIVALVYWIYYERIMFAEEQFLRRKFGNVYDEWSKNVNPFLPSLGNFKRPALPFSFRSVLKREYNSFGSVFLVFSLLDLIRNYRIYNEITITPVWLYLVIFAACAWLIIRILRKRTGVLNAKGR